MTQNLHKKYHTEKIIILLLVLFNLAFLIPLAMPNNIDLSPLSAEYASNEIANDYIHGSLLDLFVIDYVASKNDKGEICVNYQTFFGASIFYKCINK